MVRSHSHWGKVAIPRGLPTARDAAVAYAAARVARSAQSVAPPPPSLVYQRRDRAAHNWIAKVRISGVVKHVGTYGSRTEATEAYFAALISQPSPARPDPSRPTHYRGICLHCCLLLGLDT